MAANYENALAIGLDKRNPLHSQAQTCERPLPVRSIQLSPGEADGQEVLSLQRLSVLGEQNMNLHPPHRPGFFLRLEDRTTRDKPSVVVLEWLLSRGQSRTA